MTDGDAATGDRRRNEILWLLQHRNDHLPLETRSATPVAAPGFVSGTDQAGHPVRWLTCPDCLTNGRAMAGCETCGGCGELPDDGPDPYAISTVLPVGFTATRHDATHERDRKLEMLQRQTRPAPTEAELLAEANRRGYAWEEERRVMYRRYDFAHIDLALDELRAHDTDAAHALNAVHVDGWLAEIGEITPLTEAHIERGLSFLNAHMPEPLRTGLNADTTRRQRRRRRAA